ncbi:brcc3 [Symbiodinium sp. KB8]|nr:brcc3 [Symbiodinium sp. KB8]
MVLSILVSLITVHATLADTVSTVQESKGTCALQTKMKKDGAAQYVTCSSEEIMCHDATTMTDSCHPKSTGCPVTCLAGEHVCHSPPTCDGCDGYNWCSSYTCPLYCGVDEVICHDSTTMTDTCHPAATGCPVTCPPSDHVCHMPATCDTCHGYSYCSPSSCPVYCGMDEVMCHDSSTMTDSCHPASTGCPITCPPGDHVCHMPPSCEGCEGHSYCSPSACPVYCGVDEVLCHDSTAMTDSCHPKSTGCPVTCPPGDNVCHVPPACDTCDGYSYCSPGSCPVYCAMDEVLCHDSATMTDSCHPASTGCPVTCPPGDHVCHMPATCDTCHGYSYCSPSSCPVYCGADEVMCHDSTTMTDSCHPKSTGCPVTCPPGDNVCHVPPPCDTCDGYSYCSPGSCPVYCAMDEVLCHDSATMTDSCHPASTGCPITCPPGDNVCHMPPTCDGCQGHSYCSPSSCPVYCGVDEVMCHDSTTMTDSCHPKSTGCPVTCPPGDNVFHVPPTCDTCDGYSYCSPGSCPVYCGIDEVMCHDSSTMTDSCHPASTGCPVTCPPGDHVCHSPATCQGCHGYNWCSTTPCAI